VLLATALVIVSSATYASSERQLLSEDAQITAAVLRSAPLYTTADLQAAANLAEGNAHASAAFAGELGANVGPGRPYVAASLWSVAGGQPRLQSELGGAALLAPSSAAAHDFVAHATSSTLHVKLVQDRGTTRLAYVIAAGGRHASVVYAEEALPLTRRPISKALAAFKQLDFALYFGRPGHGALLEANTPGPLPLRAPVATERVSFGDAPLTLVVSPRRPLRGTFAPYTRWFVGAGTVLLAISAALVIEYFVRRRERAEYAAEESVRLLAIERGITRTLQKSLLPRGLPAPSGYEFAVRYVPASAEGVEVGGDWYDVVQAGEDRLFFTVGDVSGRGVPAAALMGTLRIAIDAYAHAGDPPDVVLSRLQPFLSLDDGHFATILCGSLEMATGEIALTSAGHLPPLHLRASGAEIVALTPGPPVGVRHHASYPLTRLTLGAGESLLIFTDGLIERRDEALGASLERLRQAIDVDAPVESLLDRLVEEFAADGTDDVAILVVHRRADAAQQERSRLLGAEHARR
jgi:serine phosphatase RsbU (regulator of sigma subunit)